MRNPFLEATQVLERAIAHRVIDVSIPWESQAMRAIRALDTVKELTPPFLNVDQNSQALRPQIHTFGRSPVFDSNQDHLIELARIVVPEMQIGYLENIEQYLADVNGQFYATESQYWGRPYNETVPINDINWLFRLDDFHGLQPPRFTYSAAVIGDYRSVLPGLAWADLPEFDGIWYPATNYTCFRANIAPGKMLRLIAYVPSSSLQVYSWRISGRLIARVQSARCEEALQNTRLT
jgi:hypothetical protein